MRFLAIIFCSELNMYLWQRLTGRWAFVFKNRECYITNAMGLVGSCNTFHGWHPAYRLLWNLFWPWFILCPVLQALVFSGTCDWFPIDPADLLQWAFPIWWLVMLEVNRCLAGDCYVPYYGDWCLVRELDRFGQPTLELQALTALSSLFQLLCSTFSFVTMEFRNGWWCHLVSWVFCLQFGVNLTFSRICAVV